jgi:phosphoribosylaminoimidazolecarboxamide formyltransferase / IMP cyclohydrolase
MTRIPIRRALVSVYDKTGLAEIAKALHEGGVEIVSTGTTAQTVEQAGIPVTKVEELTGFPEALDGRVKTLHPRVHAGLLADSMNPEHNQQLTDLGIAAFQLLVSNLYPFEQTVAAGADPGDIIEKIDIGGPAMVRAAAKNHGTVAVVTSPAQYADVLKAIADNGFTLEQRRRLAAQAYAHTAAYDAAVSSWFAASYAPDETAQETGWPDFIAQAWTRAETLRYGENPHQKAALYKPKSTAQSANPLFLSAGRKLDGSPTSGKESSPRTAAGDAGTAAVDPGIASAEVLHGKAMSYNNYVDADSARRATFDFGEPCVAIIKHSNPCGIAIGTNIAAAYAKALECDPLSAYGGVIAANSAVTDAMAEHILTSFAEVVIAPDFDPAAIEILTGRWKNIRLLRCAPPPWAAGAGNGETRNRSGSGDFEFRPVSGGMLAQTSDRIDAPGDDTAAWELKAGEAADADTLADLAFAWRACQAVKSNAILLAKDGASVGVGMGQVNRVDSSRLAVARAGNRAAGSVAASDAYFPFPDGFEILAEAGVRAVAEPGGSIRDELVIEAARAAGVTLYFTGVRHFYH